MNVKRVKQTFNNKVSRTEYRNIMKTGACHEGNKEQLSQSNCITMDEETINLLLAKETELQKIKVCNMLSKSYDERTITLSAPIQILSRDRIRLYDND